MEPFTIGAQCPKCLSGDVAAFWQEGQPVGRSVTEHMIRSCRQCGFTWSELPADQDMAINRHVCPNGHPTTWEDYHVPQPDGSCILHGPGGQRATVR